LRWLHNLKNPMGRLTKWALELLQYEYEVIHRKGALHHFSDVLFRMYKKNNVEDTLMAAMNTRFNEYEMNRIGKI